ncbi:helix-turn-helix transcriptional regulator [Clostridium sp.]|uniref:helix-turn-helix domain-containing protein n=1 Tax=Clostridium sp. TaxID=1506 RepID=UPI00321793E6
MIKSTRLSKNISQNNLANALGISQGYLSKLENNTYTNISLELLFKIAEVLDICPLELVLFFARNKFCFHCNLKCILCEKNIFKM